MLKTKVVSITIEESGIAEVRYIVGRNNEEGYFPTVVSRSLKGWQHFIRDAAFRRQQRGMTDLLTELKLAGGTTMTAKRLEELRATEEPKP